MTNVDPLRFILLRCEQLQVGQSCTFSHKVVTAALPYGPGISACLAQRLLARLKDAAHGAFTAREDPVTHAVTVTRLFSIH